MGTVTHIQWTDHTFNPWEGCTKVSPGCAHCYAEARDMRFTGGKHWGKGAPRRRTSVHNWNDPRRWDREASMFVYGGERPKREAEAFGWRPHRPRVFCASLADWLDDEVEIAWLADLLKLIRETPNLDWQLLTKRPENFFARIEAAQDWHFDHGDRNVAGWLSDWRKHGIAPSNVWIGTTVEDQARADERIPHLLRIPAKIRFLSCEPLLGAVDLDFGHPKWRTAESYHSYIHWVICGGESGKGARPMHPDWARSLRDQCAAAGVAFFFKQWGEYMALSEVIHRLGEEWSDTGGRMIEHGITVHDWPDGSKSGRFGKIVSGRLLDGNEHNAFPEAKA